MQASLKSPKSLRLGREELSVEAGTKEGIGPSPLTPPNPGLHRSQGVMRRSKSSLLAITPNSILLSKI